MTEDDFTYLRAFLHRRSGLALGPDKRYLADSRLGPVCQAAGIGSLADLVQALRRSGTGRLAQAVVDAMVTHETSFFRDPSVFATLTGSVLPQLIAARRPQRRLRIWSAAASTGQEAYSIAMAMAAISPRLTGWRIEIVGTDLSAGAIERAKAGCYSQFEVQRGLPILSLLRYFKQGPDGWTARGELRGAVDFRVLNLMGDIGHLGRFDLIFCRNLLIYFDPATKAAMLGKLVSALAPDGALCLGASETVLGLSSALAPDAAARGFARLAPREARKTG